MEERKRNRCIDAYKGILISLVVVRHVLQFSVSDEGGGLTNFIWAVQMPGFMLVAGYFSYRNIISIREAIKRCLLSAQYYALPSFSWYFVMGFIRGRISGNIIERIKWLAYHVDNTLWFLWVIFVLSIIAIFVDRAISSKRHPVVQTIITLTTCFGTLLVLARLYGINLLGIKYILYYAIFYGFGWLVKWMEKWWRQWWDRISNTVYFICLVVFLGIIFNFDLYHSDDSLISILMRVVAGFTGNAVILTVCSKYESFLSRAKLDKLGMYTLEIYATHMYVNNLMGMGGGFFTAAGFGNFICSLILTVVFTTVIISTFKAI